MDERLPCGHQVPLFESIRGDLVPIAHPAIDTGFSSVSAVVWCHDGQTCGWVDVDTEQYGRIKGFRQDL